jgi:hypothetical protein
MNHLLLITFVRSMTWKDDIIIRKHFNAMWSTTIFIIDSSLVEHRVWLWLCYEHNTCSHTHTYIHSNTHTHNLFLPICASSNLSTKIYERSLIPSEKNLGVFWNWKQKIKIFQSRSRVLESKNLTPQLPICNPEKRGFYSLKKKGVIVNLKRF